MTGETTLRERLAALCDEAEHGYEGVAVLHVSEVRALLDETAAEQLTNAGDASSVAISSAEPQPEPTPERPWSDCTCPMNGPYFVGVADDCPRHGTAPEVVQDDGEASDPALSAAFHERVDGDWLIGGGGWGADGWVDDVPLGKARISDIVRWATRAILASDWLAQRDAEVAATTLEQAADEWGVIHHPYEGGGTAYLRDRAARIRTGRAT